MMDEVDDDEQQNLENGLGSELSGTAWGRPLKDERRAIGDIGLPTRKSAWNCSVYQGKIIDIPVCFGQIYNTWKRRAGCI